MTSGIITAAIECAAQADRRGKPFVSVAVCDFKDIIAKHCVGKEEMLAGPDRALRCAFCGHEYPEGTPTHKHEALVAHIRVCEAHPIGIENANLRRENDSLRRAFMRPDDLRAQIDTLVADNAKLLAVCRENLASARLILDDNEREYDAKDIIERTEAVLPPR